MNYGEKYVCLLSVQHIKDSNNCFCTVLHQFKEWILMEHKSQVLKKLCCLTCWLQLSIYLVFIHCSRLLVKCLPSSFFLGVNWQISQQLNSHQSSCLRLSVSMPVYSVLSWPIVFLRKLGNVCCISIAFPLFSKTSRLLYFPHLKRPFLRL